MSGSDKGFIFAIAIALLLLAMAWVSMRPVFPLLPTNEHKIAKENDYSPGSLRCLPSRLRHLPNEEALDEKYRCEQAVEEYRLQSDDLVQQTRSADAAVAMVELTYRQTLIGLAGAIFGLLTLIAAAFAAWHARTAARAASESNDILRKAEDAALVVNFPDGAVDPEGDYLFDIVISNVGRAATTIHSLNVSDEKIFMETVILASEQKRLNKYVVIAASNVPSFSVEIDQTTALRPRFVEIMNFVILRPQPSGPRSTWWAFRTDNLTRK